jgi:hypothetical protein
MCYDATPCSPLYSESPLTHIYFSEYPPQHPRFREERLTFEQFSERYVRITGKRFVYSDSLWYPATWQVSNKVDKAATTYQNIKSEALAGYRERLLIAYIDPKVGFGLFARESISLNSIVTLYGGNIVNCTDIESTSVNSYYASYYVSLKEDGTKKTFSAYDAVSSDPKNTQFMVDANEKGGMARFIQHFPLFGELLNLITDHHDLPLEAIACQNVEAETVFFAGVPVIAVAAMREIRKYEQIGYTYRQKYWKAKGINPELFDQHGNVISRERYRYVNSSRIPTHLLTRLNHYIAIPQRDYLVRQNVLGPAFGPLPLSLHTFAIKVRSQLHQFHDIQIELFYTHPDNQNQLSLLVIFPSKYILFVNKLILPLSDTQPKFKIMSIDDKASSERTTHLTIQNFEKEIELQKNFLILLEKLKVKLPNYPVLYIKHLDPTGLNQVLVNYRAYQPHLLPIMARGNSWFNAVIQLAANRPYNVLCEFAEILALLPARKNVADDSTPVAMLNCRLDKFARENGYKEIYETAVVDFYQMIGSIPTASTIHGTQLQILEKLVLTKNNIQSVDFTPSVPFDKFIELIRTHGPLYCRGYLGAIQYTTPATCKFSQFMGIYIFQHPAGTLKASPENVTDIVIVGAGTVPIGTATSNLVYYLDPSADCDPSEMLSCIPKLRVMSYKAFCERLLNHSILGEDNNEYLFASSCYGFLQDQNKNTLIG